MVAGFAEGEDNCQRAIDAGIFRLLTQALTAHATDNPVLRWAAIAVLRLTANSTVRAQWRTHAPRYPTHIVTRASVTLSRGTNAHIVTRASVTHQTPIRRSPDMRSQHTHPTYPSDTRPHAD